MPVGVVAVGYGDGYPRHARTGTPVLVTGHRAPLMGRVSMDMISVDLRGVPGARVGDPAVLWGEGLPIEEIAEWADTIPYQLTCAITARVQVVEADGSAGATYEAPG
jgi:alanine racemase